MATGNYLEELRRYWEVPAVAHFCSLFRSIFKLVDFDIEDFEEALIVDTESAADGGRSSLIVDVLIALIRGCLGRRDVTLLNYNTHLHDLLQLRWVGGGLGQNPLGTDRDRSCFHILPLYPKIKILHYLCEWRLERPDVEAITRNFSGDYLRVAPMGKDENGLTYWYFYGTRLYSEEDELKLKIANPNKNKKRQKSDSESTVTDSSRRKTKKRRKRSNYNFGAPKRKKRNTPSKYKRPETESEGESENSDDDAKTEDDSASNRSKTKNDSESKENKEKHIRASKIPNPSPIDDNSRTSESSRKAPSKTASKQKNEPAPASTNVSGRSSPNNSNVEETDLFRAMVDRIYSRDEDEEGEDSEDAKEGTSSSKAPSAVKKNLVDNSQDVINEETVSNTNENEVKSEEPMEVEIAPIDNNSKQETKPTESGSGVKLKKPFMPVGPPPWDQILLRPADYLRWRLVCYTLDDWRTVTDKYRHSHSKCEKDLYRIIHNDFLPAIEKLFEENEKERLRKLAELAPRRSSDRLEVKRLTKEREEKLLADREAVELKILAKQDEEKNRKLEAERRQERAKLRELEKEKRLLLKNRAREERSKRLEFRQKRQQLVAEGKDVPAELMTSTNDILTDAELDDLDNEIELEHMYGQLEKLVDCLQHHPDAQPFLVPVSEEIAPDYKDVIETPMDLETIEDKLLDREFKCKADFIKSINLMLVNCLKYNGIYSEYVKVAARFERVFIKAWKRFFPPSDLEEFSERARQEELDCISLLGALDRSIKEEVALMQRAETVPATKPKFDEAAWASKRVPTRPRRPPQTVSSNSKNLGTPTPPGKSQNVRKVFEEGFVSGPIDSTQAPAVKSSFANRMSSGNLRTVPVNDKRQSRNLPLVKGITLDERESSSSPSSCVEMPSGSSVNFHEYSSGRAQKSRSVRVDSKSTFMPDVRTPPILQRQRVESGSTADNSLQDTIVFGKPPDTMKSPIQYLRGAKPGNDQQSKTGSGQVYALQSRFGTRFCKFVDSAGNQATPEMVNQAMPILKNCIAQLPKGLSTVTISVTTPEKTAPLGITATQQRPSVSTARPAPKPENVQQKISEAPHTYTIVNPPGVNTFNVKPSGIKASASTPPKTGTAMVGGVETRLIQVNDNWYCKLSDGSACLLKKDPLTGGLITTSATKLSKEEFTKTLMSVANKSQAQGRTSSPTQIKMILPSNAVFKSPNTTGITAVGSPKFVGVATSLASLPKPVCSVAPVQQQGNRVVRPSGVTIVRPTTATVVQQNTQPQPITLQQTSAAAQAIMLGDGQQLVFTPGQLIVSQGSYLVAGTNATGQILTTGGAAGGQSLMIPTTPTSIGSTSTMQVIQVMPQQIVFNRTSSVTTGDSNHSSTSVVIQQSPSITTSSSTEINDLLAQAWQSVDPNVANSIVNVDSNQT